ncbi:MAG TPA: hypothetical protein VK939_03470 [Longimicrobiales bacterium]|nr:hypothetical protein [Longimicrobiales bacterium]
MPRQTVRRPAPRYRPAESPERYEPQAERQREPGRILEAEPRLGPYEMRYQVELGYPAPLRLR